MKRIACMLLMLVLLTTAGLSEVVQPVDMTETQIVEAEPAEEGTAETPVEAETQPEDAAPAADEPEEMPTEVEAEPGVGERFMSLEHIFAISTAGNGAADIFFETMSDSTRTNPGMVMIYKYAVGDRFPIMSLSFLGEPAENGVIERMLIITDGHIYDYTQDSFAPCQKSDYRLYLNAGAGNMLIGPEAVEVLREYLASGDGAIVIGNQKPYCVYEPTDEERTLLAGVVDEWDALWNDAWFRTLSGEDRDIFEKIFPRADRAGRAEEDLTALLEEIYYVPYPDLVRKDRGEEVRALQEALTAIGCDVGTIDGIFGEHTENAVRDVQAFLSFDPTGIADDVTRHAIERMRDAGERIDGAEKDENSVALEEIDVYSLDIALDEPLPQARK